MASNEEVLSDDDEKAGTEVEGEEYVAVDTKLDSADDDDDGDARLTEEGDDRDGIRKRRREEKTERAHRRKAAIERDKAEMQLLRKQNEELSTRLSSVEKRSSSTEYFAMDKRFRESVEEVKAAEHIIARAVEMGNGEDVARAMRIRDDAISTARQLDVARNAISRKANEPTPTFQQPPPAQLAQDWVKLNPWYDPASGDTKSQMALEIDKEISSEGYNPQSLDYWQELDKRIAELNVESKGARRGPPMGSGREHVPRSSRNEVYVSPERKQAMVDAGVWDDPASRQRYLKQYAKWDKNNATR
jgi:hypothetical protein